MSAPLPIRCARCQATIQRGQEQEVPEEQGTSSSLVYIHRSWCRPAPTRRYQ